MAEEIFEILEEKDIDFEKVEQQIMKDGAIDSETKRLIAIACAVAINCDFCVEHHTETANEEGINDDKVEEAVLVASLVGFGSRVRHLATISEKR